MKVDTSFLLYRKFRLLKHKKKHMFTKRMLDKFPEDWEILYWRYKNGELTRKYLLQQMGITTDQFKYLQKKYEKGRRQGRPQEM